MNPESASAIRRIPTAIIILALLAVADGVTTQVGMSLGIAELNPLFAPLLATVPLAAWSIYAAAWGALLVFLWWAQPRCGRRWWLAWVGFGIVGKAAIVAWNTAQLALLWWQWSLA